MSGRISSRRWRSGGSVMQTTFRRKKRSSRNCPSCDRHLEIAVGRGDDAHVDADVLPSAEPGELAVLQHLQQLGLQRRAHLADLVEEHRPVIGELELAGLVLDGAGERAALEAEELRFEQLGRQRRAIDFHERAIAPRRGRMDGARHQFLAGAALAADEDRDVGVGDALDQLAHLAHLIAAAEQLAVERRAPRARRRVATVRRGLGFARIAQARLSRPLHALQFSKASATTVTVWKCWEKLRRANENGRDGKRATAGESGSALLTMWRRYSSSRCRIP